jgi:integrase
MRAQIEAIERAGERDRGDYAGRPADPIVARPEAPELPVAKPGETIAELFEQYADENPKRISAATLAQARRDVGTFIDLKGRAFPVSGIDKVAVRERKALLRRYPVKAAELKVFKGMTFAEIIKANKTVGKPVIGDKTVNRYLAAFGAFCHWLAAHGYIEASPLTDMYLSVDHSSTKTFTVDQMNVLFASPLFTGCRNDHAWHKPGGHKIKDHRYWIPLVMLYSGARVGEVAQLAVDDVREQEGHWLLTITDEGPDQQTKTLGSNRVVPVHSELVKLGFINFVKRQREAGKTRLFPEVVRNSAGQMAATFSSKFGRYLTKLELKDGRGLSLYSFRHGFADALRRAGYLDADFGFIMGHGAATMTSRYGKLPQGILAQRVELIEAVKYAGLNLWQVK